MTEQATLQPQGSEGFHAAEARKLLITHDSLKDMGQLMIEASNDQSEPHTTHPLPEHTNTVESLLSVQENQELASLKAQLGGDSFQQKSLDAIKVIQAGGEGATDAMQKLLDSNEGLMKKIVHGIYKKSSAGHSSVNSIEDLMQDARIAMMKIAHTYDAKYGADFSTYAYRSIWGIVDRSATRNRDSFGRTPASLTLAQMTEFNHELSAVSLESEEAAAVADTYNDGRSITKPLVESSPDSLSEMQARGLIEAVLPYMTRREQDIMAAYFGLNEATLNLSRTSDEAAKILGLSSQRVGQALRQFKVIAKSKITSSGEIIEAEVSQAPDELSLAKVAEVNYAGQEGFDRLKSEYKKSITEHANRTRHLSDGWNEKNFYKYWTAIDGILAYQGNPGALLDAVKVADFDWNTDKLRDTYRSQWAKEASKQTAVAMVADFQKRYERDVTADNENSIKTKMLLVSTVLSTIDAKHAAEPHTTAGARNFLPKPHIEAITRQINAALTQVGQSADSDAA